MESQKGKFARSMVCSTPTPSDAESNPFERDALPIHVGAIDSKCLEGDGEMLAWVTLLVTVLDFHFLGCNSHSDFVPVWRPLSEKQLDTVKHLANHVRTLLKSPSMCPTIEELGKSLNSKAYDYSGEPIE